MQAYPSFYRTTSRTPRDPSPKVIDENAESSRSDSSSKQIFLLFTLARKRASGDLNPIQVSYKETPENQVSNYST